jgi:DNA-binding transcriptional ArsR family regulator
MKEVVTVADLEQVRALANPLRLRIIQAVQTEALNTKRIAQQIGEPPSKLYYHMEALERLGLIELVETRPKRGTTEKYYRSAARKFIVAHQLLAASGAADQLQTMLAGFFEVTLAEVVQHLAHPPAGAEAEHSFAVFSHGYVQATHEQISQLSAKLQAWVAECQQADQPAGDMRYGLTLAFYPVEAKE